MKKIILAGILTLIALIGLHGCAEPAETTGFQISDEVKQYTNDAIGFGLDYPANFDIKVFDEEETILRIHIGETNEETGVLTPLVLFTIERSDYFARLIEKDEPGFALRNACEAPEVADYIKDCTEMKEGITSYLEVTKMGEGKIGFQKTYFVVTSKEEWPSAAFAVNLFTEQDAAGYEDPGTELLQKDLTGSQKKRIEMTDKIVDSLRLL